MARWCRPRYWLWCPPHSTATESDQHDRFRHHRVIRWRRTGHAQVRDTVVPVGADPRHDPGFGHHMARTSLVHKVVAQQPRHLALDDRIGVASWRHRSRFTINQLPDPASRIAWVPDKEFVQCHTRRHTLAKSDHRQRLAPSADGCRRSPAKPTTSQRKITVCYQSCAFSAVCSAITIPSLPQPQACCSVSQCDDNA